MNAMTNPYYPATKEQRIRQYGFDPEEVKANLKAVGDKLERLPKDEAKAYAIKLLQNAGILDENGNTAKRYK